MIISAQVQNCRDEHQVILATNGNAHVLNIGSNPSGYGSSVNGGELLSLALATSYCNSIYREAAKRGIRVERVEVEVESKYDAAGEPASEINYRAKVKANASEEAIRELMVESDRQSEVHKTLRRSVTISMVKVEVVNTSAASEHLQFARSDY